MLKYEIKSSLKSGVFEVLHESELTPINDSRKSFYQKAFIINLEDNTKLLLSYNSIVCMIDTNDNIFINESVGKNLLFSNTTLRHIKEFIKQFSSHQGRFNYTIKEIKDFYNFYVRALK